MAEPIVINAKNYTSGFTEADRTKLNNIVKYETAGGNGTTITLTDLILEDGAWKTFIATANNNGTATTINTVPLYKPESTTAPNLVSGRAYTIWYDVAGSCFFYKASASGKATADKVLASWTFSNDEDIDIPGTMPDIGAVNQSLSINGTYTIPAGYHNGSGHVSQSIATKGAATITPGTTNQIIAANQFLSGIQTILGDTDLIPSKIPIDLNLFGVQGTRALGKKTAFGSVTASTTSVNGITADGSTAGAYKVTVTGLTFNPSIVLVFGQSGRYLTILNTAISIYDGGSSTGKILWGSYSYGPITNEASMLFRLDGTVFKNISGFTLPSVSGLVSNWIAIE